MISRGDGGGDLRVSSLLPASPNPGTDTLTWRAVFSVRLLSALDYLPLVLI